jgi:hypothetical protein
MEVPSGIITIRFLTGLTDCPERVKKQKNSGTNNIPHFIFKPATRIFKAPLCRLKRIIGMTFMRIDFEFYERAKLKQIIEIGKKIQEKIQSFMKFYLVKLRQLRSEWRHLLKI